MIDFVFFNNGYEPVDVVVFDDYNGSGLPEIGVLGDQRDGDGTVLQIRELDKTITTIKWLYFNSVFDPLAVHKVAYPGGEIPGVLLIGTDGRISTKDQTDPSGNPPVLHNVIFGSSHEAKTAVVIPDMDGPGPLGLGFGIAQTRMVNMDMKVRFKDANNVDIVTVPIP
ncbi:MAG: hypothetical protein MI865_09985 [Proteobacteria bacterium]|nr:hypothetical protein [Pseudomonadota bacterium]